MREIGEDRADFLDQLGGGGDDLGRVAGEMAATRLARMGAAAPRSVTADPTAPAGCASAPRPAGTPMPSSARNASIWSGMSVGRGPEAPVPAPARAAQAFRPTARTGSDRKRKRGWRGRRRARRGAAGRNGSGPGAGRRCRSGRGRQAGRAGRRRPVGRARRRGERAREIAVPQGVAEDLQPEHSVPPGRRRGGWCR